MTPLLAGKDASAGAGRAGEYARHRPEQTLLYQLVEQYYPALVGHLAARERTLPVHVQREFEDYPMLTRPVPVTFRESCDFYAHNSS